MSTPGSGPRPARPAGLGAYVTVTAAYWAFMLSDGALRMLALLHFHEEGFTATQLAWLFLLYEVAGIVTNLSAGWLAARFGLTRTLYAGLGLQIVALALLARMDPGWGVTASVAYVMGVQGLSGVAKDLSKMSSKSAVKLLAPEGALFGWVAALTGSKNAVKGLGFGLGALLLGVLGFEGALWAMAGVLAAILAGCAALMPPGLPRGSAKAKFREVFSKDPNVNRLSLARVFLFAARDAWFVVGVPVWFASALSDGTPEGAREAFFITGGFMSAWVIAYGAVQAAAPKLLRAKARGLAEVSGLAWGWAAGLAAVLAPMAAAAVVFGEGAGFAVPLALGLMGFGAVFAVNSSLHSYLILAFSSAGRVTMDVGFYYMSNAAGRLLGTVASGVSYQLGGLAGCLGCAALLAGLSALAARRLRAGDSAVG
ncbi:organoarsenical effux MFS transporter ArsJ [Rhodovulum sp. DZ06]|uniref:organoarsenical effux MFS transporter ArsJ n=1 Tax=Rhodovulum sp. DZ06 TaxID=3425126 RepID=UPI003D342D03